MMPIPVPAAIAVIMGLLVAFAGQRFAGAAAVASAAASAGLGAALGTALDPAAARLRKIAAVLAADLDGTAVVTADRNRPRQERHFTFDELSKIGSLVVAFLGPDDAVAAGVGFSGDGEVVLFPMRDDSVDETRALHADVGASLADGAATIPSHDYQVMRGRVVQSWLFSCLASQIELLAEDDNAAVNPIVAAWWGSREHRGPMLRNCGAIADAITEPEFFAAPLKDALRTLWPDVRVEVCAASVPVERFVEIAIDRYGGLACDVFGPIRASWATNPEWPGAQQIEEIDLYANENAPHMEVTTEEVAKDVFYELYESDDADDANDAEDDSRRSQSRDGDGPVVSDGSDESGDSDGSDGSGGADDADGADDDDADGSFVAPSAHLRSMDDGRAESNGLFYSDEDAFLSQFE